MTAHYTPATDHRRDPRALDRPATGHRDLPSGMEHISGPLQRVIEDIRKGAR